MNNFCLNLVYLIVVLFSYSYSQVNIRCTALNKIGDNCINRITLEFINISDSTLNIWKPSHTFYWFWSVEVSKKGINHFFSPREDLEWAEPPSITLHSKKVFIDTLNMPIGSFYNLSCKNRTGCNPFIDADSIRFIYNFKGDSHPKNNLTNVLINNNNPIHIMTVKGKFISNWITIQCRHSDLIESIPIKEKDSSGLDKLIEETTRNAILSKCCE